MNGPPSRPFAWAMIWSSWSIGLKPATGKKAKCCLGPFLPSASNDTPFSFTLFGPPLQFPQKKVVASTPYLGPRILLFYLSPVWPWSTPRLWSLKSRQVKLLKKKNSEWYCILLDFFGCSIPMSLPMMVELLDYFIGSVCLSFPKLNCWNLHIFGNPSLAMHWIGFFHCFHFEHYMPSYGEFGHTRSRSEEAFHIL